MKLLIVAQALDANHPILGFFVRWVEEIAKRVEKVTVIASFVGEYKLPANVSVHSLGKELGFERESRALRLPALAIALRKEYDSVFVHMIPEFVIAAGILWRLMGKHVGLWYNHDVANPWLNMAVFLVHTVFYTSPFAVTARLKKAIRMPAGIDTELFKPDPSVTKIPGSVYFQGRVAPSKNIHVLLEAFALVHAKGMAKCLTLVGPAEPSYVKPLKERYAALIREGTVIFSGPRKNSETPALYQAHTVSVNLAAAGHYDKSVLESVACGTPVLIASPAFDDIVPSQYRITSFKVSDIARALERALADSSFPPAPREAVIARHGLLILAEKLVAELS